MKEEHAVERRTDWFDVFPRRFFDWLGGPIVEFEQGLKVEDFVEDHTYVIRAEMPGLDPDKDVQVHVRGHTLEVRAERKHETKTEEKGRYRSEFSYGSFLRRVALPPDVDEHDVKATYRDGILEVRMPVETKHAETTKIPITHL
jgi:HSP20 family protein